MDNKIDQKQQSETDSDFECDDDYGEDFEIKEPKNKEEATEIWKNICGEKTNLEFENEYLQNAKLLKKFLEPTDMFNILQKADHGKGDSGFESFMWMKRKLMVLKCIIVECLSTEERIEHLKTIIDNLDADELKNTLEYLKDEEFTKAVEKVKKD